MPKSKRKGLFGEVAARAMHDALYERLIDRCWEELKEVFERPDVRKAEALIMRAIAEAFTPNGHTPPKRRKK